MGMASAVPYLLTEESGRSMADSKCNNLNKKEFIDESKKIRHRKLCLILRALEDSNSRPFGP